MKEKFTCIEKTDGLIYISNLGNIYTFDNSNELKQRKLTTIKNSKCSNLYFIHTFRGKKTKYLIKYFVAKYFVNNPNNEKYIINIDRNCENNNYKNLKWVNRVEYFNHQTMNNFTRKKIDVFCSITGLKIHTFQSINYTANKLHITKGNIYNSMYNNLIINNKYIFKNHSYKRKINTNNFITSCLIEKNIYMNKDKFKIRISDSKFGEIVDYANTLNEAIEKRNIIKNNLKNN